MYLRVAEKRTRQRFEDLWNTGIYLGLVERSNVVLVGTPNVVVKVNCIKRLPTNQAKDPELLKSIRGCSWRLSPGDVQTEPGEVPTMVASEPVVTEMNCRHDCRKSGEAECVPSQVYTRRNVGLRKYGFTQAVWLPRPVARPRIIRRRRQRIESSMEADDVERMRVEMNRRTREEAATSWRS